MASRFGATAAAATWTMTANARIPAASGLCLTPVQDATEPDHSANRPPANLRRRNVTVTRVRYRGHVPMVAPPRPVAKAASASQPLAPAPPKIDVKTLNVSYGQRRVLDCIDAEIQANQVTALIGPSG